MAKVQMQMPEDFLMKVSRLADKTDEIIPKVLEAGAEVVEDKVRSNLQSVIGSGTKYDSRSTGELLRSLGTSPALQDRNGDFDIKVGFSEPRSDGDSNAKIATILEYGKSGQPAIPFLKPARSSSRNACINAMMATLDEEVERSGVCFRKPRLRSPAADCLWRQACSPGSRRRNMWWSRLWRIPMNSTRITYRGMKPRRRGSPCSPRAIIRSGKSSFQMRSLPLIL